MVPGYKIKQATVRYPPQPLLVTAGKNKPAPTNPDTIAQVLILSTDVL
jgi:hypothetical protein